MVIGASFMTVLIVVWLIISGIAAILSRATKVKTN